MNRLIEIGFEKVGHWQVDAGKISCVLSRMASKRNILYAFICDGEVKYIGKTKSELSTRLTGYRSPGRTQTTNLRNNASIRAALEGDGAVDIFALPDDGLLHYGRFHLNLAAGLEDDLIRVIDPEWNGGHMEVEEVTEDAQTSPPIPPASADPAMFSLVLHPTYFSSGFFNVRVPHEHLFGGDGERIEFHIPGRPQPLHGMINRTANLNGTPRIMGGTELRDWFQDACREGETLSVRVLSRNSIEFGPGE